MQLAAGRFPFLNLLVTNSLEATMLKQPQQEYRAFPPVALRDRTWPDGGDADARAVAYLELRVGEMQTSLAEDSSRSSGARPWPTS
jgi:hypothetical protein